MFQKVKVENLPTYISKIEEIFPEFRDHTEVTLSDIRSYYRESFWGYAIFHSWAGAVHMALSEGGKFSKNDYFRQAEEVEAMLSSMGDRPVNVLEVGCGRGFNIAYLARRFPSVNFIGIDISASNIRSAKKINAGLRNTRFELGDFHELPETLSEKFDLVFAVETLCHSPDVGKALQSLSSVTKMGGRWIVFDGFRESSEFQDKLIEKAVLYTERAMAVPEFRTVATFSECTKLAGMSVESQTDRSAEIMPNLMRLSDLAKMFFKIKAVSKVILFILPRGLVRWCMARRASSLLPASRHWQKPVMVM